MYYSMRMSLNYFSMLTSHCNSALQYVAALQCVAVCCSCWSSDIQSFGTKRDKNWLFDAPHDLNYLSMLMLLQQCVAVCCSVVQCVAVVDLWIINHSKLQEITLIIRCACLELLESPWTQQERLTRKETNVPQGGEDAQDALKGGHPDDLVEVPMLPPDHYGCGLGCTRFTGTLAAVEEHECGCSHWLHDLLPEGLQRDLLSADEDERALTLLDIVEPLQYPLSVLQKARRHVFASPPLVASDEMTPLWPANRHPAIPQKLRTSKQPTPAAAPASAPPLSSASIALSSLFLNLLTWTHPRKQEIRI